MNEAPAEREIEAIVAAALANGIAPELPFSRIVGLVIAQMRTKSGLSQERLSAVSAISQSTLSRIESGEASVDAAQAFRLSKALGVRPDAIFAMAALVTDTLERKRAHVTGEASNRKVPPNTSSRTGGALLAPIIGVSLLGPVGLLIGSMVSGFMVLKNRDREKK